LADKHQKVEVEVKTKDSVIASLNTELAKLNLELETIKAEIR
jgi:hypothetical protein